MNIVLQFHDGIASEVIEQFRSGKFKIQYQVSIPQDRILESKINLLNHFKNNGSHRQLSYWLLIDNCDILAIQGCWKGIIVYTTAQNFMLSKQFQMLIQKIPIISVSNVQDINDIIIMNQQMLKMRWKFQKMHFKASAEYDKKKVYEQIKQLAEKLIIKNRKADIKQTTRWLNYAKIKRINCLKRYFLYWNIYKSERVLETCNIQITQKQYLTERVKKALKRKAFNALKFLLLNKRNSNEIKRTQQF